MNYTIKVADFGLTEDVYTSNYFRQGKDVKVKLPMKWMAPESLHDGVFTEQTDVVSNYNNDHCDGLGLYMAYMAVYYTVCIYALNEAYYSFHIPTHTVVVIWSDLLGDIQRRTKSIPWHRSILSDAATLRWQAPGTASQFGLLR